MTSTFPDSVDDFDTSMVGGGLMNSPSHAVQHQKIGDALEKIETYVSSSVARTTVSAPGTSAGATAVPIPANAMISVGDIVAVGAKSTKCEIRLVRSGSTSTSLTVLALQAAHSAGEQVVVLTRFKVPLEWFGARVDDATAGATNSAAIAQAFADCASQNLLYGLEGRGSQHPYYVDRPQYVYDFTEHDDIYLRLTTGTFDWMTGKRGTVGGAVGIEPDQFLYMVCGKFGYVSSVNAGTDVLTLDQDPGAEAWKVSFLAAPGSTLPAGLEAGRAYYCKSKSGSATKVSIDQYGTAVDITSAGSGTIYWFGTGFARARRKGIRLNGDNVRGVNGAFEVLQQPSQSYGLRCENFPGARGGLVTGSQEGQYFSTELFGNRVNWRLSTGEMIHAYGTNIDYGDWGIILEQNGWVTGAGGADGGSSPGCMNCVFHGGHAEATIDIINRIQRVAGNVSVTSGTYTLTFRGQTTSAIAFGANAATVQTALEALSTIDPGDIVCLAESGGPQAGGSMRVTFTDTGQYSYIAFTPYGYLITIGTGSLVGGTYSMDYAFPEKRLISLREGLGIHISDWITNSGPSFYTRELGDYANTDMTAGATLTMIWSTGQAGYAVEDKNQSRTIPWADSTEGGCGQVLEYYNPGAWHAGTGNHEGWQMHSYAGGSLRWEAAKAYLKFAGGAYIQMDEVGSAPAAPAANRGRLYVEDNGSGKSRLAIRFPSGAAQVIATEP